MSVRGFEECVCVIVDADAWHLQEYVCDVFERRVGVSQHVDGPDCYVWTVSSLPQIFFSFVGPKPYCQFLVHLQGVYVFLRLQQQVVVWFFVCLHLQEIGLGLW